MKTLKSANIWALSTLGIAMLITPNLKSQPLDDKVTVTMPYTTIIGHKTLPPGDYMIRRMSSPGGSRVLLVYSDDGMKFETSAMTIPVLDPDVARDTKIILSKVGSDYYYDKVWVQGKSYGYQFILPREARARQRELLAINANGSSSSSSTVTTTTETAQVEQPVVTEEQTAAVTQPTQPVETQTEIAQAEPAPAPVSEPELAPLPENTADRAADEPAPAPAPAREEMPATAAGWMALVMGGTSLLGMGLKLRRKA